MHPTELLFLGVLAGSIFTSTYVVGLCLLRIRARYSGVPGDTEEDFIDLNTFTAPERRPRSTRIWNSLAMRERRMQLCTGGPDLLVVPGYGYAAVLLPFDIGESGRDLVKCHLYLN
ncbi:MAG TPA: hypothetical protein VFG50_13890 [Rhodothermales bacterium]|nr:hypothetical protein [Rhodothermales bacterium]